MPAKTLQINFSRIHRPNQRRVRYPLLRTIGRLVLLVVALAVMIAILMKLGFLKDPEKEVLISAEPDFRPMASWPNSLPHLIPRLL